MARTKDIPNPWINLEPWRGDVFEGEFPTLPELFEISEKRYPDRRCFTCYDPTEMQFTYTEAWKKINQVANYLLNIGLSKGEHVGLTGKNSPEWAISYLAILTAGGVVVPVDYSLKTDDVSRLLEFADINILFVDSEKFDDLKPSAHKGKLKKISLSPDKTDYVLDINFSQTIEHEKAGEDDTAAILFTSGTTGEPKGAMLSHKNFVSDCFMFQGNMNIYHTDVFYALLPIHHSYTMLAVFIEAFSVGAELVFAKKVVVQQIFKDLKKAKVTMFLGIPMLFNKIIKGLMNGIREKGIVVYGLIRFMMGFSGLVKKIFGVNIGKSLFGGILSKVSLDTNRICICGGGPLPAETFKYFNQMGIDFVVGYGLTEAAPGLTLNPIYAYRESSIGKIIPLVEMKVLDPDSDGTGELIARGPNIMKGYYKNEQASKEAFTEDGWLLTGDSGYIDDENYVYLTGRKKNMIVTEGGKNVFPEEIEDHFQLFDEIEQILVRGYVQDEKMQTEGIEAVIVPSEDFAKNNTDEDIKTRLDQIIDEVNREMLPYKRISRISVRKEEMEMSSTKKIKRFKVE
ncbi:MAG: class I adenylate-forming enzyme family protein [Spirochaetales bacterium]|uniref:Class I adenylate-forming enzyme family protein n=1 Tax=Candidatus Thalassospirochaeta sargassi TaxID=3119039 RepID=A0AAJ1IGD2_9SPIO|nr:class I adenylate-forming enzyme family protein [Spirochaetales bacterium]